MPKVTITAIKVVALLASCWLQMGCQRAISTREHGDPASHRTGATAQSPLTDTFPPMASQATCVDLLSLSGSTTFDDFWNFLGKKWHEGSLPKNGSELMSAFAEDDEFRPFLVDALNVYISDGLPARAVDPAHPRIIMFHGNLIITIVAPSDPIHQQLASTIEVFEALSDGWTTHIIDLSLLASEPFDPTRIDQNALESASDGCRVCHGAYERPVFGSYRVWLGFHQVPSIVVREIPNTDPYRLISQSSDYDGAQTFQAFLNAITFRHIMAELSKTASFDTEAYQRALVAALLDCSNIPSYLGKQKGRHDRLLDSRLSREEWDAKKLLEDIAATDAENGWNYHFSRYLDDTKQVIETRRLEDIRLAEDHIRTLLAGLGKPTTVDNPVRLAKQTFVAEIHPSDTSACGDDVDSDRCLALLALMSEVDYFESLTIPSFDGFSAGMEASRMAGLRYLFESRESIDFSRFSTDFRPGKGMLGYSYSFASSGSDKGGIEMLMCLLIPELQKRVPETSEWLQLVTSWRADDRIQPKRLCQPLLRLAQDPAR